MSITTLEVKQFIRQPYAWPGGYPMHLVLDDGEALCKKCARSEWPAICDSMRTATDDGWRVIAARINWESVVYCAHCNERIEAAYLDDAELEAAEAAEDDRCDQCNELMINGVRCHETGCPNVRLGT